jgi:hypothetical protein
MSGKVVVAVFPSRDLLTNALDHITNLGDVAVRRAAIVARAASGEMVILDDKISANDGGFVGGVIGGILGAFLIGQQGALELTGFPSIMMLALGFIMGVLIGAPVAWFLADRFALNKKFNRFTALAPRIPTGRLALILEIKRDDVMHKLLIHELNQFQAEFVSSDY